MIAKCYHEEYMNPYKATEKYPGMNLYDALEIESVKKRNKMIGVRVTNEDFKSLKKIAFQKRATITQVVFLILRHRLYELQCNSIENKSITKKKGIVTEKMRWEILERDDFRCKNCGSRKFLHIDHIHPKSKGGTATQKNLQTLCRKCNLKKGSKT